MRAPTILYVLKEGFPDVLKRPKIYFQEPNSLYNCVALCATLIHTLILPLILDQTWPVRKNLHPYT